MSRIAIVPSQQVTPTEFENGTHRTRQIAPPKILYLENIMPLFPARSLFNQTNFGVQSANQGKFANERNGGILRVWKALGVLTLQIALIWRSFST